MTATPVVGVCPYLQMRESVRLGEWWLGPVDRFEGSWCSPELEGATRNLLAMFVGVDGKPIDRPSLLAHADRGVDGRLPPAGVRAAIALTIQYLVLENNPHWEPDGFVGAERISTTDNADLWFQPLSAGGTLALERGGRVRTLAGGFRLGDAAVAIRAPLELHMPLPVSLDADLGTALFHTLNEPPTEAGKWPSRIRTAIHWLAKAWHNSAALRDEDRLVYLKTATEALTGTSNPHRAQKRLVDLFSGARDQPGDGIGMDGLLWSADEPTYPREAPGGETVVVTAFGEWYHHLAKVRNEIIHDGETPVLEYNRQGSTYNGPLVDVAETVVREAIAVALGECGYPFAWRRGLSRASFNALAHLETSFPRAAEDS